jgi:O-Antigen ligase
MAVAAHGHLISPAIHAPQLNLAGERVRGALLWLTGFSGAFVFVEPGPYEICSLLTIILFAITGLTLRPALMPLIGMLTLYALGFALAVIQVSDKTQAVTWVLVSWYLCLTAVFYAAMLGTNTRARLDLLTHGCLMAAAITSLIAILAYFHAFGSYSDLFLRYERARGTFNDPNVLGAFLIFPALLALQRVLSGRLAAAIGGSLLLALIGAALLLSFSRGAWGQFAFTAALLMLLTFITSRSGNERLRIVLIALAGAVALVLFVVALLSIDRVAELFKARAILEQSYDVGRLGRFGRYSLGAGLALDTPLGIGPMQFATKFIEDPHNTYLNAFMAGGWLSGCVYLVLTMTTIVMGLRFAFVATPWRAIYLAVYAAYVGVALESAIIDTDHWRHYFLLLGLLWGLMVVSRPHARLTRGSAAPAIPRGPPAGLAPARRAA